MATDTSRFFFCIEKQIKSIIYLFICYSLEFRKCHFYIPFLLKMKCNLEINLIYQDFFVRHRHLYLTVDCSERGERGV